MITSVTNQKIKDVIKESQNDLFIVEGLHLVEEASKLGLVKEIFTIDSNLNGTLVSENVMKKLCTTSSIVKVCALCYKKYDQILGDKIIILDGVQDPKNLGAIIRNAVAFGFDSLFLGIGCASPFLPKVTRATQGAIFKIKFQSGNVLDFIHQIKKDYHIYGTALKESSNLEQVKAYKKMAIIFGSEGLGISEDILNETNENIYIPIKNIESLNVAVASGIIMYKLKEDDK